MQYSAPKTVELIGGHLPDGFTYYSLQQALDCLDESFSLLFEGASENEQQHQRLNLLVFMIEAALCQAFLVSERAIPENIRRFPGEIHQELIEICPEDNPLTEYGFICHKDGYVSYNNHRGQLKIPAIALELAKEAFIANYLQPHDQQKIGAILLPEEVTRNAPENRRKTIEFALKKIKSRCRKLGERFDQQAMPPPKKDFLEFMRRLLPKHYVHKEKYSYETDFEVMGIKFRHDGRPPRNRKSYWEKIFPEYYQE